MTSPTYKRKFLADGDIPDDDTTWDEQDAELAKGAPLELGPLAGRTDPAGIADTPWWKYQDQLPNSPMGGDGEPESYARADTDSPDGPPNAGPPDAAKGVSSKGAPISDAAMAGDTTPDASQTPDAQPKSTWERYREAEAQMPVKGKVPWYMDLAGRAAGAAAGWTNAAGRIRNPIDVAALKEGVEHPGFAHKQEQWESQMNPIRAELAAEMGQREAQLKQQDIASQAEQRRKLGEQEAARAHWYEAQAGQKWQVDPRAGVIYNRDSGALVSLPVTKDPVETYQKVLAVTGDKNAAIAAAGWGKGAPAPRPLNPIQQAQDILLHPEKHTPAEVAAATNLTRKQFAPPRGSTASGAPRPAGQATFSAIEGQRTAAYTAAQARFERAMAAAGNNPQARQQAQANLATEKRMADEGYARRVAAARGTAVTPPPPANRPPLAQIPGLR